MTSPRGSVKTEALQPNSVVSDKIAPDAINATHIADDAVGTAAIATGAVTSPLLNLTTTSLLGSGGVAMAAGATIYFGIGGSAVLAAGTWLLIFSAVILTNAATPLPLTQAVFCDGTGAALYTSGSTGGVAGCALNPIGYAVATLTGSTYKVGALCSTNNATLASTTCFAIRIG